MIGPIGSPLQVNQSQNQNQNQNYRSITKDPAYSEASSPEYDDRLVPDSQKSDGNSALKNDKKKNGECQTCKNRKYQDGSNDPGVSFKTPTKIDSGNAASAVRGHEMEHVSRERAKAIQNDRKIVYQNVTMHTSICPECGKNYVSGGTTTTATKENVKEEAIQQEEKDGLGKFIDRNA